MSTATGFETLKLNIGEPQTIALQYADGKPVQSRFSGDQLMFSLVDGRKWYTEPYVQMKLDAIRVQPGEPFEVEKRESQSGNRRTVQIEVRALPRRANGTAPARSAVNGGSPTPFNPTAPPPPKNGAGETSADIMARCYHQAIDVALGAVTYAEAKGLRITPCFEDVRCIAATICINESGGRR
jgi:hypothetical protein